MSTHYARDLRKPMRVERNGVAHTVAHVSSVDFTGGRRVVVTYDACGCHRGPVRSVEYSPVDLVTVLD